MAKENIAKIGDLGCALNLSRLQKEKKEEKSNIKDSEMVVEPGDQPQEKSLFLLDEMNESNLLELNETNLLSSFRSTEK